jgi:hypothetical protein
MLDFIKRAGYSLGIPQNSLRFSTQLEHELAVQVEGVKSIISLSLKTFMIASVAALSGVTTIILLVILAYELLLPHTGSATALAILAGAFAVSGLLLTWKMLQMNSRIPHLPKMHIPPVYVPVEPAVQHASGINPGIKSNQERSVPEKSLELSDFLLCEFERQLNRSSLNASVKGFATFLGDDQNRIAKNALGNLEQKLSTSGTLGKYGILVAATAAGFLVSRNSQ